MGEKVDITAEARRSAEIRREEKQNRIFVREKAKTGKKNLYIKWLRHKWLCHRGEERQEVYFCIRKDKTRKKAFIYNEEYGNRAKVMASMVNEETNIFSIWWLATWGVRAYDEMCFHTVQPRFFFQGGSG
jgi:hypothetical protein